MIIVSFFLIGGCNNSGSTATEEARTIGEIEGVIVPAVKAEFALQRWQEGDPDGNIFLNGSRVSGLTQSEEDALNNAYQSGFFVSLISPETEDMNDLLVVLGLQPLIRENRPVDLYAVSREFNVSGVRHFTIDSLDLVDQVNPIELRFHRERVERLITWAIDQDQTQLTTSVRETGAAPMELTNIADSVTHTLIWSWAAGKTVYPTLRGQVPFSLSDFEGHFQLTLQSWSVHSVVSNTDFYFFLTDSVFTPNTTIRKSPSDPWPCNFQQPPFLMGIVTGPVYQAIPSLKGVTAYEVMTSIPNFTTSVVLNLESNPLTTEPTVTTESSISKTLSGSVSFSTEDGAMVGVSDSVTYDNSTSYSSTAITTTNLNNEGPNGNNAEWIYDVAQSNVTTSTFQPKAQWVLQADASTRAGGTLEVVPGLSFSGYLISCAANPGSLMRFPDPAQAADGPTEQWNIAIPVPPTPPPPTPPPPTPTPPPSCTMGSCPVGQVCATDLTPPICVPQPCDESMVCPLGFDCKNDVCEPLG